MRTSVNLREKDLPRLAMVFEQCGCSSSELINICLKKYFASITKTLRTSNIFRLVKYQPDGLGYKITNIVFDVGVYNLAVNFRVFCRLSVSKMVSIALDLYLDEVVREKSGEEETQHNYFDYKHIMRHNKPKRACFWQVEWRVLEEKLKE